MADPDYLKEGDCYFRVGYLDDELFIPMIETYLYIKSDVGEDNLKYWLFMDANSHIDPAKELPYLGVAEENLSSMLTISELSTHLQGLEHLHPLSGVVASKKIALTEKNRYFINEQIEKVFCSEGDSITITTSFRDKGVSLSRNDSSVNISMFLDFRENPDEEKIIRSIFSKNGIPAVRDYLAQHERKRILNYSVEDAALAEAIICDIFADAYRIYEHELLRVR